MAKISNAMRSPKDGLPIIAQEVLLNLAIIQHLLILHIQIASKIHRFAQPDIMEIPQVLTNVSIAQIIHLQ